MIKSGITCFGDLYFHEDAVAQAVKDIGLRVVLAEGIIEAGNKNRGEKMLRRGLGFAERYNGSAEGRIHTMLGPHASYSCGSELLVKIKEKALQLGIGVHTHIAESRDMSKDLEKEYKTSEVEYLDRIGFLNDRVLAAHCIDLSTRDMQIISKRGVNAAHAPVANMKLGLNVARIKELIDLGVNVGLGTDGLASNNSLDMFETLKTAALLQKHACHDPAVLSSHELLKMATIKGAKALGLEREVGSLEVGKRADIILIDMSKPHLKPLHSVCANLVYSARGSDVDTVIVDGKVLMEKRHIKTLNEIAVMEKAEETALDLVAR
jgi:5-methylthioadenosine/S-adenosylhomocysteine deaminase